MLIEFRQAPAYCYYGTSRFEDDTRGITALHAQPCTLLHPQRALPRTRRTIAGRMLPREGNLTRVQVRAMAGVQARLQADLARSRMSDDAVANPRSINDGCVS